jgi:hypothetical protein
MPSFERPNEPEQSTNVVFLIACRCLLKALEELQRSRFIDGTPHPIKGPKAHSD